MLDQNTYQPIIKLDGPVLKPGFESAHKIISSVNAGEVATTQVVTLEGVTQEIGDEIVAKIEAAQLTGQAKVPQEINTAPIRERVTLNANDIRATASQIPE